jgi:ankyrin repeat protein
LYAHFGEQRVFMDVSAIEPGEDFANAIGTKVHTCDAAVVLIGKNWLSKRLEEPGDFVSLEITSALQRGIPVVPVLVEDARLPSRAELPDALKPLCQRQALELTNSMFHEDVQRLIRALDRVCSEQTTLPNPQSTPAQHSRSGSRWMSLAVIAVLAIAGLIYFFIRGSSRKERPVTRASVMRSGNGAVNALERPPSALITAIQEGRLSDAIKLITNRADVNAHNADGTTALMQAAEGSPYMPNNAQAVSMLLDKGAEVDAQDNRGHTALFRAASEGKIEAMRLLLARRANPNHQAFDGSTPLLTAVTYGRLDAVNLLLESGAKVDLADAQGTTPLALAAAGTPYMPNDAPLVQALLDKGAKVDAEDSRAQTALLRAAAEGKTEAMQLLLDRTANPNARTSMGATSLMEAITYGHQPAAQLLLQRGADMDLADTQGNTPLMIAAEGTPYFPNNVPMTATVLEAKPKIDAQDSRGRSALYRAASEGKTEAMRLLLDKAANANLQANDGSTPLLQAVTYGKLSAAALLLDRGAKVDRADANGNTPLMVAAEGSPYIKESSDFLTLLLSHKAQPSLADNRGRSALARAIETKNTAAIEVLKKLNTSDRVAATYK